MQAVAKSVLAGTIGGAFLPLCVLLPTFLFSFADPNAGLPWSRAALLLYPVGLSFAFASLGMILIGLPATVLLRRLGREGQTAYALVGAIAGGLVTLGFFGGAGLFVICGVLSGAMTGYAWGSERLAATAWNVP
jgi:hypothetical protein